MTTMELNPEQEDAVTAEGSLAVIASAGTGKTTVLTSRFARHLSRGIPPSRLLAFTFTEKATREMKERILVNAMLGTAALPELNVSTIHAFCGDVLRRYGELEGLKPDFSVLDERAHAAMTRQRLKALANRALSAGDPAFREFHARYGSFRLHAALEELNLVNLVLAEGDALSCRAETEDEAMRAFIATNKAWQERLLEERATNGTLSYDDLETLVIRLLRRHPQVKAALQRRFDRILVDEFQDTSPRQFEILTHLFHPDANSLFAVGDPKQAIYGFRHADAHTFRALQDLILTHGGRVITLTRTFRTPIRLQEFFNASFPAVLNRGDEKLFVPAVTENLAESSVEALPPEPERDGEEDASAALSKRAADLAASLVLSGEPPSSITILAPTRKHFDATAQALMGLGVPVVVEKRGDHFDDDLVLLLFHALNALSEKCDKITVSGILRNPLIGFDETFLAEILSRGLENPLLAPETSAIDSASREQSALWSRFRTVWNGLADAALHLSATEICRTLFHALLPDADARQLKVFTEFSAILESWRRQGAFSAGAAAELLRELSASGARTKTPDPGEEGVRLLTVHGAKGLEFDHVIILPGGKESPGRVPFLWDKNRGFAFKLPVLGMKTGLKPDLADSSAYAELKAAATPIDREETARLVYVALTRSRRNLYFLPEKPRGKEFTAALAKNPEDTAPIKNFNEWLSWLAGRPGVEPLKIPVNIDPGYISPYASSGTVPNQGALQYAPTGSTPPKPSFSVTALESFARCPKKFQLAYVENRVPAIRNEFSKSRSRTVNAAGKTAWTSLNPTERGTLFHEILQFYDPARGNFDEVVDQALFNQRLPDELGEIRAVCRDFIAKLHADPETDAILFRNRGTERELEFSLELENLILSGQIDKTALVETAAGGKEWIVIDYKTHALRSEKEAATLMAGFAFQLKCYALALARSVDQKGVMAAVTFTSIGKTKSLHFSETDLRAFESELGETGRQMETAVARREFAFTRDAGNCENCPYFAGNDCGVRPSD